MGGWQRRVEGGVGGEDVGGRAGRGEGGLVRGRIGRRGGDGRRLAEPEVCKSGWPGGRAMGPVEFYSWRVVQTVGGRSSRCEWLGISAGRLVIQLVIGKRFG